MRCDWDWKDHDVGAEVEGGEFVVEYTTSRVPPATIMEEPNESFDMASITTVPHTPTSTHPVGSGAP
jgi:hypothetical protein